MKIVPGKSFSYSIIDEFGEIVVTGFSSWEAAKNWIKNQ